MLRFLDAHWRFMEKVNGHAPFFGRKSLDISDSFFSLWTAVLRFLCDLATKKTILATGERTCSVFSSDFQLFRRYWTDMLRFLGQFQADFQLKSGWIEPLLVGGYAPFSPPDARKSADGSVLVPAVCNTLQSLHAPNVTTSLSFGSCLQRYIHLHL